eukprot:gene9370-19434_t
MADDDSSNSERKRWENVTISELASRLVYDENVSEIRDRKVILLMGTTNSGKTTTLCYLARKQLQVTYEKEQLDNGEFISGIDEVIETKELFENFKIGHSNESTTKSIQLCNLPDSDTLLADSCGFDDSEGVLVDISNAIILRNAMLSCASIFPVLVIDFRNLTTDKASAFTKLLKLISRFFSPIADVIQNISFLFTHCSQNIKEANIRFSISKLMKADYILQNPDMKIITEYLFNYVGKHGSKTILLPADMTSDDCDESRQAVLNLIQSAPPITDFTTLGHPLSSEAQIGIHEKCQECRISITLLLKSSKYRNVQSEIDTLKTLNEKIGLPSVTEQYQMAFDEIVSHIKDLIHAADGFIVNELYENLNENLGKINNSKALQDYFDVTTEFNRLLKSLDVVVKDICYKIHSTPETTPDSLLAMNQMAAIHNDVSKFIQSDAKNSYTMLKNEIEGRARGCNDNCASVIKELQSVINKATKESSDVIESYLSRSQDMFQHLSHLLILKSFASHLSPQWIACYDDRLDAIISVLEDLRAEVFDENGLMSLIKSQQCDDSTLSRLSFVHGILKGICSSGMKDHFSNEELEVVDIHIVQHVTDIINEFSQSIDTYIIHNQFVNIVIPLKIISSVFLHDDSFNSMRNNTVKHIQDIISKKLHIIYMDTIQLQSDLLQRDVVEVSDYAKVVDNTKLLQEASCLDHLLIWSDMQDNDNENNNNSNHISDWVCSIITSATSEWQQRLKKLNETITGCGDVTDTILPNTATSIFLRLDRMACPLENLISTIVQKSVSFSSEDRMTLLKFVPLFTSKKRDVIIGISRFLKDIKDKAHEAFLKRDCSIVHENLDMLQEYITLDEFLDPKAAIIYEEFKSILRTEINIMNTSANNHVSNGELDKANEVRSFFEHASVFASHFLEYDFNSMAKDLLGKHREAADKIFDEIQILLRDDGNNNFDLIRDKLRNVLKGDGDTYWDPKNKSIYEKCDKLLSDHFRKLRKKASDCETKDDEDAIDSLFALLQICDGAMDLTGMVTYDPKNVLTNIYDICSTVYNRIESNIKRNITKFKFRVSSKLFDVIKRFNQMDVFTNHIKEHLSDNDGSRIDFKQRTEGLLTNQIMNLKEYLMNLCREFLMYNDLNNKDSMDFYEPNFDKLSHLLDNIVLADTSDHGLFNDKVDFQEIKFDIVNLIFEYSQNIDRIFKDLIFHEEFDKANHLHDFMNSIRGLAEKFMAPSKFSKIRQQCERQAEDIYITKQTDITHRFSFSSHEIEKFAISLDKLHRSNFASYKQALTNFSIKLHEEYKNFEKYTFHPEIITSSSDNNNLRYAFEFIQCLWEYECRIGCPDDPQLQKLCNNSNDQFHAFLSYRFSYCRDQLRKGENIEIIQLELLKMNKITTQGLEALARCTILIESKCDISNTTTTTSATTISTSTSTSTSSISYWNRVSQNISNHQRVLNQCNEKCNELQTQALAKINELVEHEKSMKKYNIFDVQNMEEIIPKLDSLGKQLHGEKQPPKRSFFDMDEANSNNHGPGEIFDHIRKQLHESVQNVQTLLVNKDYSTLAVGVYNINQLENSNALQSTCVDVNKEIFTIVQEAYTQLLNNFTIAFQNNNPMELDKIVQEAEALDKAFQSHQLSHVFEPLMDKVKSEFCQVMDQLVDREKGNAVSVDDHARIIHSVKVFVENISSKDIQQLAHHRIGRYIETLSLIKTDLFALGTALSNLGPLGVLITEEYSQFKSVLTKKFNEATAKITIDHALNDLAAKNPNVFTNEKKNILKDIYQRYVTAFEGYLKTYLHGYGNSFSSQPLEYLIQHILQKSRSFSNKFDLAELLAGVFAVWTILTSKDMFNDTKDRHCLIKPHPIQLIAIFCLLGLDSKDGMWMTFSSAVRSITGGGKTNQPILDGHLIQVGTGEGKSVLLGGLSCLLAIFGYEVSCASYSKYLSKRDYDAFEELFKLFEVDGNIEYSTLSDLMESIINRNGNIRDLTIQRLFKPSYITDTNTNSNNGVEESKCQTNDTKKSPMKNNSSAKRILLIDEVDVFFSKDFFGATYNPIATFKSEETVSILTYIFTYRMNSLTLDQIKALPAYTALINKCYDEVIPVIDQQIKAMLRDVKTFNDPPYEVVIVEGVGKRIGYKTLDCVDTKISYGYKTSFAYLYEEKRRLLPIAIANEHLALSIPCGSFSFADVPIRYFQCIMGVTGTLSCLSAAEKDIVQNDYMISKMTITPSIYGNSKL